MLGTFSNLVSWLKKYMYMPVGPPLKVARNCNALAVEKANNIETLPTPVNQSYRIGGLKDFG